MSVIVHIEPFDTLFSRDHRPFSAGQDTFAESQIPSPMTTYGMLGSYILESLGTELSAFAITGGTHPKLGNYDENLYSSGLKIKGPVLHCLGRYYFPPPANLFYTGSRGFRKPHIAVPSVLNGRKWDIGDDKGIRPLSLPPSQTRPEPLDEYLPIDELKMFLKGELKIIQFSLKEERFFLREDRYGHALSPITLTVEENYLYSAKHLRFNDMVDAKIYRKAGLAVWVNGNNDSINKSDFVISSITLGGEGRRVKITAEEGFNPFFDMRKAILSKITADKRFLLYFMTPSIFKHGWCSDWPQPDFDGAKMVGAAVNKPQLVSGWLRGGSRSKGNPRPLKRMVSAGSVYFFEAAIWDSGRFESFFDKYNFGESLSDEYRSAGYGTALVGVW